MSARAALLNITTTQFISIGNSSYVLDIKFSFFPNLIPLSGVATTCFHHVVTKIRQLFLRLAACLTSTLLELEWVETTTNAAGTNGLRAFRSTEELEIINFGYPSEN
jgi:hypothetical protein